MPATRSSALRSCSTACSCARWRWDQRAARSAASMPRAGHGLEPVGRERHEVAAVGAAVAGLDGLGGPLVQARPPADAEVLVERLVDQAVREPEPTHARCALDDDPRRDRGVEALEER